jgi:hypothetical protein
MPQLTRRLSPPTAMLAAFLLVFSLSSSGQDIPPSPKWLQEMQIKALMTGETELLKSSLYDTAVVGLTKEWTGFAARDFASQKVIVDSDAASILSQFIYDGAYNFMAREASYETLPYPTQDLQKAVTSVIVQAKKENPSEPKVDKGVLSFIHDFICPLWPFCSK